MKRIKCYVLIDEFSHVRYANGAKHHVIWERGRFGKAYQRKLKIIEGTFTPKKGKKS